MIIEPRWGSERPAPGRVHSFNVGCRSPDRYGVPADDDVAPAPLIAEDGPDADARGAAGAAELERVGLAHGARSCPRSRRTSANNAGIAVRAAATNASAAAISLRGSSSGSSVRFPLRTQTGPVPDSTA